MHVLSRKVEQHWSRNLDVSGPMKNWTDYLNMYWQLMDCFRSVESLTKHLDPIGAVVVLCLENGHVALLATPAGRHGRNGAVARGPHQTGAGHPLIFI
ncbi:hypothetical protein EVAR_32828_1 [Eumeta japonica]|uniref:Uncharacterized protein n=1 Tax=Eumeta variegata TaxID=151549 RepID=A0A4C1WE38_EUMVA|nr:hypothetical protein EVAR_32828_1 [Eumeta japonica]